MAEFFQQGPQLDNQYCGDILLRELLQRCLPEEMLQDIEPDLVQMGEKAVGDLLIMSKDAETNEPRLIQYDPWGQRVDNIEVSWGWQQLNVVSAEEGLVAIAYERKYAAYSRLYQFAKLYLFDPSSAVYTCPLAMTDGAARIIEVHGDDYLRERAYRRLTSRNPKEFWTSGQWMTERIGGSDVRQTQTIARQDSSGYRLYGTKWFTSATTSQMAMTLARVEASQQPGLSLFYLETRNEAGQLNDIVIHRLKDKLGTRAVPTAELSLQGTTARLIGDVGEGIKRISILLNITRLHNAIGAIAKMRRGLALAYNYAQKREAFGKTLWEHPLHRETLGRLQCEFEGCFHLVAYAALLLGKEECGEASEEQKSLLRILTPIAKLYTGKRCIAVISEILECFGGAGYIEDTRLPVLLRDCQVLSIWEGTTNILSLDVLRAIHKNAALPPLLEDIDRRIQKCSHLQLAGEVVKTREALATLSHFPTVAEKNGGEWLERSARDFAFGMARTFIASLLLEHAQWAITQKQELRPLYMAKRWFHQPLVNLPTIENPREETWWQTMRGEN